MCSKKCKRGLRVIEARELLPRPGCVTRLAPGYRTVRTHLHHAFLELASMRIRMATRAVQSFPVVDHCLRLELC